MTAPRVNVAVGEKLYKRALRACPGCETFQRWDFQTGGIWTNEMADWLAWMHNNAAALLDAAEREQATTRDVNAALRRLREDNDRLREALGYLRSAFVLVLSSKPCTFVDEALSACDAALAPAPATGDKWDAPEGRTHYDVAHAVALKDAERAVVEAAKRFRDGAAPNRAAGALYLDEAVDALRALEQKP